MKEKSTTYFPRKLLQPIGNFLSGQLKRLELRRKEVKSDDPYRDLSGAGENSAPDAEASEQVGHLRSLALQVALSRKIVQTRRALARVRLGNYGICEKCGSMIDTDRLMIYPEATLCVNCEKRKENKTKS